MIKCLNFFFIQTARRRFSFTHMSRIEHLIIFGVWSILLICIQTWLWRTLLISWFRMITEWLCLMLIICEIMFNRKTLLTIYACQDSFDLLGTHFRFHFVCFVFTITWPYIIWSLIFSLFLFIPSFLSLCSSILAFVSVTEPSPGLLIFYQ